MLVDSELAKEKLAKLCEKVEGGGYDVEWNRTLGVIEFWEKCADECAAAIRAADLSDCAPIMPAENVVALQLRGMAAEVALEGYGRFQSICIDAADLIESLSAQVAELKRQLEQADIREQIMIDEAKEGE